MLTPTPNHEPQERTTTGPENPCEDEEYANSCHSAPFTK